MAHFEPPLQRYGDTQVYIPGNKQWLNITTLGIHSRAIAMVHTPLWSTTFQTMTLLTTVHVHCNCTNSQKERCVYSHAKLRNRIGLTSWTNHECSLTKLRAMTRLELGPQMHQRTTLRCKKPIGFFETTSLGTAAKCTPSFDLSFHSAKNLLEI